MASVAPRSVVPCADITVTRDVDAGQERYIIDGMERLERVLGIVGV